MQAPIRRARAVITSIAIAIAVASVALPVFVHAIPLAVAILMGAIATLLGVIFAPIRMPWWVRAGLASILTLVALVALASYFPTIVSAMIGLFGGIPAAIAALLSAVIALVGVLVAQVVTIIIQIVTVRKASRDQTREQVSANTRAQEEASQKYIVEISELLTKELSRETEPDNDETSELRAIILRARVLAALSRLDDNHKKLLLQFLHETKLTQSDTPVGGFFLEAFPAFSESSMFESEQPVGLLDGVNLSDANLESIDLSRDSLRGANLRGANLRGANLRGAKVGRDVGLAYITRILFAVLAANISGGPDPIISAVGGADLRGANLRGADLRDAVLRGTIADGANLTKANLRGADLRDAELGSIKWLGMATSPTRLHNADLSGANLRDAEVSSEQLNALKSLEGATMPVGQKYEDWLKDKKKRGEYLTPRDMAYLSVLKEREGYGRDR